MKMSITQALAEVKLIDKKIIRKIKETSFVVANKKTATKVNGSTTIETFNSNAKAEYQSISSLIERRKLIKSLIVSSNATTVVEVANKKMTVADAIERKDSISHEQAFLSELESQYYLALSKVTRENEMAQQKANDLVTTSMGKEGRQKASEEEINAIFNASFAANEFLLIDPVGLAEKIKTMKEDIENFLYNVDFSLSTSNAITQITIPE